MCPVRIDDSLSSLSLRTKLVGDKVRVSFTVCDEAR